MTLIYLKRGEAPAPAEAVNLSGSVAARLAELETGREATAERLSAELDRWQGDIVVSEEAMAAACARVTGVLMGPCADSPCCLVGAIRDFARP